MIIMKRIFTVSFLLLIILITGCNGNQEFISNNSVKEENTLTMLHPGPPGHPYTLGAEKFKEIVEEESNGSINIDIFPNDELTSGTKTIESVQLGTADIALESTMTFSNFVSEIGVLNLPFLFPDRNSAYEVLDGEVGKDLAIKSEMEGFKLLSYWDNGFRNISSDRPINEPEDIKGLSIRVPESAEFISTFETLGANSTPMAFDEVFTALQLNMINGQENPNGHMIDYNLYEVQSHFALTQHIFTAQPLIMNLEVFNELSNEEQEILLGASQEAAFYQRELSSDMEQDYLEEIKDNVDEVTTPDQDAFQKEIEPVYEYFENDYGNILEEILAITQ